MTLLHDKAKKVMAQQKRSCDNAALAKLLRVLAQKEHVILAQIVRRPY